MGGGLEEAKRVGQLLGYTDNDFCWFEGSKYNNPVTLALMNATVDLRRWARKESMLLETDAAKNTQAGQVLPIRPL